jgi:hypothetical protein
VTSGDGGRRSRRGYAYQDAVTLLDCLDMHDGMFDEVGFEELDDITCARGDDTIFRQVKTKEDSTRYSISSVCTPEIRKYAETSILGRLFSDKPITGKSKFCLLLNETPTADLATFRAERGESSCSAPDKYRNDIARRLKDLPVPGGFTISWFIDRFEIMVEPRAIEDVEAVLLTRLAGPVATMLGTQPLFSELEDVLIRLSTQVSRDARAFQPMRWTAASFAEKLQIAVTRATGQRPDGTSAPLPSLAEKLAPAGLTVEEVDGQREAMLAYRRRYRSAVGQERALMNEISDNVFAVCAYISAQRRSGQIADGPVAYAATLDALVNFGSSRIGMISQFEKMAALADITARCRNRYSDVS